MPRLTIRVDFDDGAAFGPGKARLLEMIDETGSLRRAAATMNMSYRRAWLLLQETEAMMRVPVAAARTGGSKGGGTALTPFGRSVVEFYRAIEAGAARATTGELRALSGMTKRQPANSTRSRKVTRAKSRKSS